MEVISRLTSYRSARELADSGADKISSADTGSASSPRGNAANLDDSSISNYTFVRRRYISSMFGRGESHGEAGSGEARNSTSHGDRRRECYFSHGCESKSI